MSPRAMRSVVSIYLFLLLSAKQLYTFTDENLKHKDAIFLLIITLLLPSYNGVFKTIRIVAVVALPAKLSIVYITVAMAENAVF